VVGIRAEPATDDAIHVTVDDVQRVPETFTEHGRELVREHDRAMAPAGATDGDR
jgi:hypothetical protein